MQYSELKTAIQDYAQNSEATFVSHINDFIIAAEDAVFLAVQMPAFWKSDVGRTCTAGTAEYTLDAGVLDIFSVRIGGSSITQSSGVQKGPVKYLLLKDYDFMLEAYPGIDSSSVKSATVTGISQASEAVVTATNSFANGDIVLLDGVSGMTDVNGNYYVVSDRSDSNFKIKSGSSYVNSSAFSAYSSGGVASDGLSTGVPKYYAVSSASVSTSDPTMTIRLGPVPNDSYPITVDYSGKTTTDSITDGGDTKKTWLSVTAPDVLLYGSLMQAYVFMKGEPDMIQVYDTKFKEALGLLKNMGESRQVDDNYVSSASNASAG